MAEEERQNGAANAQGSGVRRTTGAAKPAPDSQTKAKEASRVGSSGGRPAEAAPPAGTAPPAPAQLPSGLQQPAAQAEKLSADEIMPPEIRRLSFPFLSRVPVRAIAIMACLGALAFVTVLIIGLTLRTGGSPPAQTGERHLPAGPLAEGAEEEAGAAPDLSEVSYQEMMDQAEREVNKGEFAAASRLYSAAAAREEAGLPRMLLARFKLSEVLLRLGKCDEALRICESLRSVSRPGDELWKNSLIGSIRVLAEQRRWEDFFRQVFLLRANSARYADATALDRWLAYCQAAARVRIFLAHSTEGSALYGMKLPPFGQAPCAARPLMAESIVPVSGKYGDGTLKAEFSQGELHLVSEGAPLGRVLDEVANVAGLTLAYTGPKDYVVSACIEALSAEQGLEIVLGSLGLATDNKDGKLVVRPMDPLPKSQADALKAAMWALQEFLILYPESVQVAEAYYALGHLYMSQGQTKMALDQLEILCREFPRSPWSVCGHYIAGRAFCDIQEWGRAERELLGAVDRDPNGPLAQSAFLWAAQAQVELRKYSEAVVCFRRALASPTQDPLAPTILYKIAFCLEKSGASPSEVEERYMELRSRYPGTAYAREVDYRLGRMALDAGDHQKAIARYEFYLGAWSLEAKLSRQACADLVLAYARAGDYVRAVLLGEIMCGGFGREPEYQQALPTLLEAYEKAGLHAAGMDLVERSLEAVQDPEARLLLSVAKARFLVDLGRFDEARTLLGQLGDNLKGRDLLYEAKLVEAKMLLAGKEPDRGLALCREIALKCPSQETCAKALTLMGQRYEASKRFDKAALAYAGKCPLDSEGSAP
jgi:TolA-binding protein